MTNPAARRAFTVVELIAVMAILLVGLALVIPALSAARMNANRSQCASNLRQIGMALHLYANENNGFFPPTTHTTGSRRVEQSWVYGIADYLDDIDKIRVCPADPPARQQQILSRHATSYALNELVFDDENYNQVYRISRPSQTLLAAILSENRTPSPTWDHMHCGEWTSWQKMLNDAQADRHMVGAPAQAAAQRIRGSANYLFADGHVENIPAAEMKRRLDSGINPAEVPVSP